LQEVGAMLCQLGRYINYQNDLVRLRKAMRHSG